MNLLQAIKQHLSNLDDVATGEKLYRLLPSPSKKILADWEKGKNLHQLKKAGFWEGIINTLEFGLNNNLILPEALNVEIEGFEFTEAEEPSAAITPEPTNSYPPELEAMIQEKGKLSNRIEMLHNSLFNFPEDNEPSNVENRRVIADEINQVGKRISEIQTKQNLFEDEGIFFLDLEASPDGIAELNTIRRNSASNRKKWENKLAEELAKPVDAQNIVKIKEAETKIAQFKLEQESADFKIKQIRNYEKRK